MVCIVNKTKVKLSLSKAAGFFEDLVKGRAKNSALTQIAISLNKHLWNWVYVSNPYEVYSIDGANEMRNLIKTNGVPRLGKYNKRYMDYKILKGLPPHEFTGKTKRNTFIEIIGNKVLFYIPSTSTTRSSISNFRSFVDYLPGKGPITSKMSVYNFGPIHEKRKSILKATVVFAWRDIMKRITNKYKFYAER